MRPADNMEKLVKKLRYKASAETRDRVLDNVIKALDESEKQKTGETSPGTWRIIMKSPITKIAATVAVIAGAIIVIHFMSLSTMTFAKVVQPILNAQTAEIDIVMGEDGQGPVIHDMIKGARIRRTMSTMEDVVTIIDLETGKIMTLTVSKKEAVYVDLKGLPSIPNYLEMLRNIINMLQNSPHFEVEDLGQQEIEGQRVIGFRAFHPKVELIIWADPETALPVRVEQTEQQIKIICKNVKFDEPLDDSLFSMDVPEGYTMRQAELDLMGSTEEDFIEGLRIRAETFGDGVFPESVAVEDYIKQVPEIEKKIEELGLSGEEELALGMKLSRHLLFIRIFKGQGQWHYAGNGVKLGDADAAVFWYQPADSETWRVIYGDLHVEDVAQENLPQ